MSADTVERLLEVESRQKSIEEVRLFAERAAADRDPACREAVVLAVQELAENLAKYGGSEETPGRIVLLLSDDRVRIRIVNAACSRDDGERAQGMIAEINASSNVRELYRLRQRELFENPELPRVRLGLLRVAFEGGFRLSCSYEPPRLEILAERP